MHSNEADPANVRYLSDYWPAFESAGVVVPRDGKPILLIGPESELYAKDRSRIKKIMKLLEYREAAEPEYPDIKIDTFNDVFRGAVERVHCLAVMASFSRFLGDERPFKLKS